MKIIDEKIWNVESAQRNNGSINRFTVSLPQYYSSCQPNQRIKLKLVSFNIPHSFYNIDDGVINSNIDSNPDPNISKNNTFNIIYTSGGVSTLYTLQMNPGFYTTWSSIFTQISGTLSTIPNMSTITITADPFSNTNKGYWHWTGTSGDSIRIQFPIGRNSAALLGLPYNLGNYYTLPIVNNGSGSFTFTTPYPMMFNYIQNINLRIDAGFMQNIEYSYTDGSTTFSNLFAKIPVIADPYNNIYFNAQDTEQYVILYPKGSPLSQITFTITDDYQVLLNCPYNWEAVIKIETLQDDETETWMNDMKTNVENILMTLTDVEHILVGESREHETEPNSLLYTLEQDMAGLKESFDTAFLVNGEESVFIASGIVSPVDVGPSSIANRIRVMQGAIDTIANIDLPAISVAVGAMGITSAFNDTLSEVKGLTSAFNDTLSAVTDFNNSFKTDYFPAIKRDLDAMNATSTEFVDYMKGKTTGYSILGTLNKEQGFKDYLGSMVETFQKLEPLVDKLDLIKGAISEKDFEQLTTLAQQFKIINEQGIPSMSRELQNINEQGIPSVSEQLQNINEQGIPSINDILNNIWKNITGGSKITYESQIEQLKTTKNIDKWVKSNNNLTFDSQKSDVSSYNKLVSTAITIEDQTKNANLEKWIEHHPPQ